MLPDAHTPSLFLTNIRIISPTAQRTPSTCPACPYQRICQPYPHVIRQANDCLPESCSRNPLAAGLPQQETRMSFNRRAANLTRGGIKMKSIQTKFIVLILGCILLSSSVIGGAGILNAKHVVDEDSVKIMNLMCKEKNRKSMRCLENPAIGQDAGRLLHRAA